MDLAVRTTASPGAVWAIVIVAVVFLAFWLIMVMVFAARPDPRFRQAVAMPGPAPSGIDMTAGDRSVLAGDSAGPEAARVPAQRGPAAPKPAGAAPANVVDGSSTT